LLLIVLGTYPGLRLSADDRPSETAGEAEQFVQQLGAPSYRDRDEASRSLANLGRHARTALLRAIDSSDAEVELADRYDQIKSMEQREAVLHERERIARDIHDTVGGRFSSAIMMTDLIKQQKTPESRLDSLRDVLSDGLTEVRHLVTAMVGDISNTTDLIYYVADKSASTLQSVDINLHSRFDLADQALAISNLQAMNVARVLQEATNNVIKHSGAESATLTASDKDGRLTVSLEDSGIGIPEGQGDPSSVRTYGLAGMKIRCDEVGATLKVSNSKDGGCVVSLSLELGHPGQAQ
jgi:signal transduction histidine kinase